jgi:hypothetical protein
MNRLTLAIAVSVVGVAAAAQAQVYTVYRPIVAYPAPVTAYYAPAPVTAYYAPAPVPYTAYYAPGPVVYGGPAVIPPRYFYPGQPVRNFFRRPVVAW